MMGIVDRPIQRVDVPLMAITARAAAFFGQDVMIGKIFLYLPKQEGFRLPVNFGDQVNDTFKVYLVVFVISGA